MGLKGTILSTETLSLGKEIEVVPLHLEISERSNKIFGTLIKKLEDNEAIDRIKKIKEYIENVLKPLAKQNNVSLCTLMSGETSISNGKYFMDFGTIAVKKGLIKRTNKLSDGTFSPSGFLLTGANYGKFIREMPNEHYKIYLSLDLSTEIKKQKAEEFGLELIKKAKEKKISLTMKTFDHNYDSCNMYTWDINEIVIILKELYAKYEKYGIFLDVYHFLQQPIKGINPNHIGIVQEPISLCGFKSHSCRMGDLGKYLDQGKSYEEACKLTGVKIDSPWEIDIKN